MRMTKLAFSSLAVLALVACSGAEKETKADTVDTKAAKVEKIYDASKKERAPVEYFQFDTAELPEGNSVLAAWEGPYGGVPAFDTVSLDDLKAALEWGMARNLAEVDQITANPDAPTFFNTIVPLEKSGEDLSRVFSYWGIWSSNRSSDEFRAIQSEMVPVLSEFNSKITQNEALFNRIEAVYEDKAALKELTPEAQRIVKLSYEGLVRSGAKLDEEKKKRYAAINKRLSTLYTTFSNNILHDEESYTTYLTEDQLDGLPEAFVKSIATDDGRWAIKNTRSSMDPFLTNSTNRDLRKTVWENYYNRGDNGGEYDNNAIIAEILKLRDERVELLGFDNFAEWRLGDRMAKTPENAMALMETVWPAATARVAEEVADMQALADAEENGVTIEPWDYRYYMEKVRKDRYDLNSDEVKEYLQLDKLTDAMFMVAGELFNYEFVPVPDGSVPVFHEDVNVWEVKDKTTGKHIGLWYLDPFARDGKRSGAWATYYRAYTTYDGERNVLSSNNSNFIKGAPGEPVLVSWDDAETFFHEFGHALHFLAADVEYPSSHGGVRDYTEFQSQLLERWLSTDRVINNYLVHYETGEPMPPELIEKIKKAATFNQGFATTEYLASALMDMKYHTTDPDEIEPDAFERNTLAALGMPTELPMRHRSPHFGHVFSGEGYATAYYGYMWADVLTSDAAEAFAESPGGFYDRDMAQKLRDHLFAPRNAVDPADAYRAFRGRDADMSALMRDRGFPVPGEN